MTSEQTVFIVEPDVAHRASIAALAASMGLRRQEFDSAEAFLAAYDRSRGGCLISAVRLPGMSGLDLMDVMAREGGRLSTIIAGTSLDVRIAVRAMQAGAVTVLDKPYRDQELCQAIDAALRLDTRTKERKAQSVRAQRQLSSLTRDEQRVLECILAGKPNKAIARELSTGLRTVVARRHALMVKLEAKSLMDLVQRVTEAQTPPAHGD